MPAEVCRRRFPLRAVPFREMTDTILRQELETALGNDYEIVRELPQLTGITAYSARSVRDGSRVEISAVPSNLLSGTIAPGDPTLGNSRLRHANILPVIDSGTYENTFYWVASEVEARTLRSRLARGGRVDLKDSLILLRDMSAALAHAHVHGVVHGGLSPDSVLISGGSALVSNLGLSQVFSSLNRPRDRGAFTAPGGGESFRYLSPEQVSGAPADARSDVYAWGVIAYELLAGRHPFTGRNTPREMVAAHAAEDPPQLLAGRFDVPAAVTRLVMKCLSKDPAKRPQAAGEICDILTREMLAPPPAAPAGSGQKMAIALVAMLAAAVAALALFGTSP